MKAFIAGGTGFLGRGATDALLEAGHTVRCMARSKSVGKIPQLKGVEPFVYDYVNAGRMAQGMGGCDVVFNLVGIIREFPTEGATFQKIHIDFTRQLLEACEIAGVKRYLHMSALGVDSGLEIGYNTSKLAAEKIIRESSLNWTIFRPSLIFGAGDRFAVEFCGWMKKKIPIPVIGKGDYRLMPVSRSDLCRGMVKLLDNPAAYKRIYNIGGAETLNYIEILNIIEEAAGVRKIMLKIPAGLIMLGASLMGQYKFFPATKDMIRQLLRESITGETDFWKDTGIEPETLKDGLPTYI